MYLHACVDFGLVFDQQLDHVVVTVLTSHEQRGSAILYRSEIQFYINISKFLIIL